MQDSQKYLPKKYYQCIDNSLGKLGKQVFLHTFFIISYFFKISLSCFDDKRYIHENGVTSYAYGYANGEILWIY